MAFIVYRRRQKAASKSSNHTGTGYYSNNASSQFTHPNATNGGAVADDIRFDMDLAGFRVPQQEIQNIQLLVKGGYGVVFKATLHGTDVAMKQLLPSKAKDHNAILVPVFDDFSFSKLLLQEFMNEIRLCARLEHPKIVKFVGISWSTLHDLAVLSEFMPHGDVTDLLKAERKRPKKERVFHWLPTGVHPTTKTAVAADVADALCFLHSFQPTIIHRDLKSKNVLLSATWEAKLSDFGISRVTSNEETMTSNIGTVAWIAPEVQSFSIEVRVSDHSLLGLDGRPLLGEGRHLQFWRLPLRDGHARVAVLEPHRAEPGPGLLERAHCHDGQ